MGQKHSILLSPQRQVQRSAFTASSGNLPELQGSELIYNQSTADIRRHRYFQQTSERVMVGNLFTAIHSHRTITTCGFMSRSHTACLEQYLIEKSR